VRDKAKYKIYQKKYREDYPEYFGNYFREYYRRNKEILLEKNRLYRAKQPWLNSWRHAKYRCTNPKHKQYKNYGGRGIKFLLTKEEIKKLWFRDKARFLTWASIDREDSDGNYEYSNCRFIEKTKNTRRYR